MWIVEKKMESVESSGRIDIVEFGPANQLFSTSQPSPNLNLPVNVWARSKF